MLVRRVATCCALGAAVELTLATARAAGEPSELRYEKTADALGCPDADALRKSVADRLGYDPFSRSGGERVVVVRVRKGDGATGESGHTGTVQVLRTDAPPSEERTLFAAGECSELIQTLALTISIALDPESALANRGPAAAPPEKSEPRHWSLTLAAGPSVSVGETPAVVLGGVLASELRVGRQLGVVLEGRASLPGSTSTARGDVSAWSAGGLLGGCGHAEIFFACLDGQAGVVAARGELSGRSGTAAVFYVGPRLGVALPLGSLFELRVQGDALWSLARPRLTIGDQEVYEFPPGYLSLAALFGVRL
jgi:hypothetical protein